MKLKKKKWATKSLCSKTGNQSDLELVVLNNQLIHGGSPESSILHEERENI